MLILCSSAYTISLFFVFLFLNDYKYILESETITSATSPQATGFCADSCRATTYSSLQQKALASISVQLHKTSNGVSCET